jgi:hypothetical protein
MQRACAVLYCFLLPVLFYPVFALYLTYDTVFRKVTEHKLCVLIFRKTLVQNIPHFKKDLDRYYVKLNIGFHVE